MSDSPVYYDDEIEKLKYLRNRIASEMVTSGYFPDSISIEKRLAAIDTKLALFDHISVKRSDKFDVKAFNQDFLNAYQDLVILYKLVYKYSITEYESTKAYAAMHLKQLESLADRYERKGEFETNNTALGNTIFFQSNGFDVTTKNHISSYDLGVVDLSPGSKISFYIDGRYFTNDDVTFYLNEGTDSEMSGVPYKINGDYITVPGASQFKTYNYNSPVGENHNAMFVMNVSDTDFMPDMNKRYIIYGGQNCYTASTSTETKYYTKLNGSANMNEGVGRISFYVVDGSYISFDFSKKPLSQNFTGYEINNLPSRKKISFEYEGPFSFDFVTDGTIYATRQLGVVKNGFLYYPDADPLYKFMIEEYGKFDTTSYDLSMKINQVTYYEPTVTMVAVKELTILNEVEENSD